jgi:hypothetical protein
MDLDAVRDRWDELQSVDVLALRDAAQTGRRVGVI